MTLSIHASIDAGSLPAKAGASLLNPACFASRTAHSNDRTAPQVGQVLTPLTISPQQDGHKPVEGVKSR
ncbi:hypothetical protein [Mesorhizobium sp.]|uniref:hypothetical protein n=1 Tax=Mesorhizobium sp. TaxID=1871066 RepID=UPI0025CE0E62|nr:hypothetical protein [Mesorhizobium sp.]